MGGRVDRDPCRPFGPLLTIRSGKLARESETDPLDRAEDGGQGLHVVDTNIEQRSCPGLEEEVGIRVPGFHAVAQHLGADRDRVADEPVVEVLAGTLQAAAEEGVRRGTDEHAFGGSIGQQLLAVFAVDRQRFFVVGGFAVGDRLERDLRHARPES